MSFIGKLFGFSEKNHNMDNRPIEELRNDPNLIQLYDEYGREFFVEKEIWRKDILPKNLKDNWNKPDDLYTTIVMALNDGYFEDVLSAAKHFDDLENSSVRSTCVLGIVLMKLKNFDESENIFQHYIEKHGEEGVILSNLAKVHSEKGDTQKAEEVLWHALELDPNQDNGFQWWVAIQNEKNGEVGYKNSLQKLSRIDGSWRAQLWIARDELENQQYSNAIEIYKDILKNKNPIPIDMLMQISGDLGNNGRLSDIVSLIHPHFNAATHGLMVGNNLLKAYIELDDVKNAKKILNELYSLNRPDFKQNLEYWDNQIYQKTSALGSTPEINQDSITSIGIKNPVWTHQLQNFENLLPPKDVTAPVIAFISLSCITDIDTITVQRTSNEGAFSRSIPLFLAEQIIMNTNGTAIVFVPVLKKDGTFILSGKPWENEKLINLTQSADCDYIVNGHLDAANSIWKFDLELFSIKKKNSLFNFQFEIDSNRPGIAIEKISHQFKKLCKLHCGLIISNSSFEYSLPKGQHFDQYLYALQQSLALTNTTIEYSTPKSLYNERNIFDTMLELTIDNSDSNIAQLLLISSLMKNKIYGSKIYLDYEQKVRKLQRDIPLKGISLEIANQTIDNLYSESLTK